MERKSRKPEGDQGKRSVQSYENLMGTVIRSAIYRPERRRIRDLVSRNAKPTLTIGEASYPIFDISMNGVSFLDADQSESWPIGEEAAIIITFHGEVFFRGQGRVARREIGPRGVKVGIGLIHGFLDLPEIQRRDDERLLSEELSNGALRERDRVPAGYRHVVDEIQHFYQYYRDRLDYHESRYRREGASPFDITNLTRRAADALRETYKDLQIRASTAAMECLADRDTLVAAKQFTEHVVVPMTMDVPLNRRAYGKPLGYPGDFKVMQYYYANSFEGDSVYAKVLHKFAVEHPLSNGVRTRKDLMVEMMAEENLRHRQDAGEESTFRVTSLGCGPAQEVAEFIASHQTWPGRIVWTLIDQEEQALSVAYRQCLAEAAKSDSKAELHLLNLSFVQLLSEGLPLEWAEPQDFVFSAGLFDYLREERAQALVRGLYELLAPGGLLAIGNARAPQPMFWSAEFLVDWTLLYRTEDEVRRLACLLPKSAQTAVVLEPGEAYYFLTIRKPQ